MKKKIISLIIGFVLIISFAYAVDIISKNRQIIINNDIETELSTKGIDTWNYEDYIGTDEMYRCLKSNTNYNLPCSDKYKTYKENCIQYNITDTSWEETTYTYVLTEFQIGEGDNITYGERYDKVPNGTIFHNESFQSECLVYEKIYYTTEEKDNILDEWETEKMEQIGKSIKIRREKAELILSREGGVTIK